VRATLLELAVLDDNRNEARRYLELALNHVRESWECTTTAGNMSYIMTARGARGLDTKWLTDIIETLNRKSRCDVKAPGRRVPSDVLYAQVGSNRIGRGQIAWLERAACGEEFRLSWR
jgi:hypothetical protein